MSRQSDNWSMLTDRWEDLRVAWKLFLDEEVSFGLKLIPVLAFVYLLSPVDLIPDPLLGAGQVDDIGVILLALGLFLRLAPPSSLARARRELGQSVEDEVDVQVYREDEES